MFKNFLLLTRFYSAPMSITPFLAAVGVAWYNTYHFDYLEFIFNAVLVLIGVLTVHLGGNLLDDILDVERELKKGIPLNEINFKNKAKAKLITQGTITLKEAKTYATTMFGAALVIGFYFILLRGIDIAFIMAAGALLCIFYPESSKYGLSEITIGLLFGPLLMTGSYLALTGYISPDIIYFSAASGIVTSILLIAHSLMDFEYDTANGKNTLPVLLKDKNITVNLISILYLISYFIVTFGVLELYLKRIYLLCIVLSFPIALKLIFSLYDYINFRGNYDKQWFFGPMENFESLKENNMLYFMYRFYLARNAAAAFNLALFLAAIL